MNAPISELMGAALGTPETSQPAPSGHPDINKPHAYEFGRMDHEGRFKVVIEHRYPTHAKSDWPVVPLYRHPAPAAGNAQTAAARDVLAERQRQISAEGWTPEHDDAHADEQLARAAACYALPQGDYEIPEPPEFWPWEVAWWKPGDRRRELIKAGALILAGIERLDRAAMASKQGK